MLAQVSGAVSLVCLVVAVGSLALLHLVPTGLSPVLAAVSQYGISRYRSGYRVMTISLGLAVAALGVGLAARISEAGGTTVLVLMAIFSAARLVISWYPMDAPGAPRTPHGHAHGLIAIVTFTSITVAALRLGAALHRPIQLHALAPVSTAFGAAMAACVIAMVSARSSPSARNYFGLVERGLYLAIIGWIGVLAVALAVGVN